MKIVLEKKTIIIIMVLMMTFSSLGFAEGIDFDSEEYVSDLKVLETILEQNHGNLYESIEKEELDKQFVDFKARINDDMTIQDYYTELSKIVKSLNDGHTYITPSDLYVDEIKANMLYLPLKVRLIGDEGYVDSNNKYIPIGSKIVSINDQSFKNVLDRLRNSFGSESDNKNGLVDDNIEKNLFYFYPMMVEGSNTNKIVYIDSKTNREKTVTLKSEEFSTLYFSNGYGHSNYLKGSFGPTKDPLKLEIQDDVAILRIYTFNVDDKSWFMKYTDEAFAEINRLNINKLVLDVRGNTGGKTELMNHILSYVVPKETKSVDHMIVKNSDFVRLDLLEEGSNELFDDMYYQVQKEGKQMEDGNYFIDIPPIEIAVANHYDKQIIALMDNGTFSCGGIFVQTIQKLDNGQLIGETNSTNYYGSTAGYMPTFVLPNTKIGLTIPLTQMTIEKEELEGKTKTMPVTPDFIVELDAKDFINKIDTQLKYALKLFK